MAINVDKVYKTVLLIFNKEQRGYLTPYEFNKIATQVQLEIFETYFETLNQQLRIPQNESEYGDRYKTVEEKLDIFKTIGTPTYVNPATGEDYFDVPATSGAVTLTQLFSSVSLQLVYPLTTITQAQVNSGVVEVTNAGVALAPNAYTITSGNLNLVTAIPTGAANNIQIKVTPQDFYKLGTVFYKTDREIQAVQRNELAQMNMSTITKPSNFCPVYLYENRRIIIFPQTITSEVTLSYLRQPVDVMWNFTSGNDGQYVYDGANSVDFELDISETTTVILEILKYAGVTIKDIGIVQVAGQELAANEINEKQ